MSATEPMPGARPQHWPDLLLQTDPSWLTAIGVDSMDRQRWLESSVVARRTLTFALHRQHSLTTLTDEACRILDWLSGPLSAVTVARRLAASACSDGIRHCIAGPAVAELRSLLGVRFFGALVGGSAPPFVTLPPKGIAQALVSGSAGEFLLSLGKALLLASAPATDESARRCIELALPRSTDPMSVAGLDVESDSISTVLGWARSCG